MALVVDAWMGTKMDSRTMNRPRVRYNCLTDNMAKAKRERKARGDYQRMANAGLIHSAQAMIITHALILAANEHHHS